MKTMKAKSGDEIDRVHTLVTKNLVVSWHTVPETDWCYTRWVFLARLRNEDQPEVVAHATVNGLGNFLEWIEVNTRHRRKGIGREFRAAIETLIQGELNSEAATDDGFAFRTALGLEGH